MPTRAAKASSYSKPEDVFVSYAREDADIVSQLAEELKKNGISVWVDTSDIEPGTMNWELKVRETISKSIVLILVATPDSFQSKYVQGEVGWALHNNIKIIPIRVVDAAWKECVSFELAKTDYIDCRPHVFETGAHRLAEVVRKTLKPELEARKATASMVHVAVISPRSTEAIERLADVIDSIGMLSEQESKSSGSEAPIVDITLYRASSRSQIMTALGRLQSKAPWDIVHLSGYEIVTSENDPGAPPTADDNSLTPQILSEMLSLSLPVGVPLVVIDTYTAETDAPNWDVKDCTWIDQIALCAEAILCMETPKSELSDLFSEGGVTFLGAFYSAYARRRAVASALDEARLHIKLSGNAARHRGTLRIRTQFSQDGLTVVGRISGQREPFTLDLHGVQDSLVRLGLAPAQIFDRLARKIQAHRAAFEIPRENAFLAIDPTLYGEFSWNTTGAITCSNLYRFDGDVDPNRWRAWSRLLVTYNDLWAESRQNLDQRELPTARVALTQCLRRFERRMPTLQQIVDELIEAGCTDAWRPLSDCRTNLEMAEDKLIEDEYGKASTYLETALMCLHELVKMYNPLE